MIKLISWNVNGLRACCDKGFRDIFTQLDADFSACKRRRCRKDSLTSLLKAILPTGIMPRRKDIPALPSLPSTSLCKLLTVWELTSTTMKDVSLHWRWKIFLVTVYTPNSQDGLKRLDYRMTWDDDFRAYLQKLDQSKPVLVCGDLNVAHKEIDLKNPKTNRMNAGFTDQEREKFQLLLDAGFIDTFRYFYPEQTNIYSWWSYRFKAREKNAGWRIDYFLASASLADKLKEAKIHTEIFGSDHCPVEVTVEI